MNSLSSGLTAADGDGINCDCIEEFGANIQEKVNNIRVTEASLKRNHQVHSLNHPQPAIQIEKKKYHIDPMKLFSRLIAIVQREEDMIPYFSYELTGIPTSIFKDGVMRKTQKSQLAKLVTSDVQPAECNVRTSYVIDGWALLHKVKWAKKAAYKDIHSCNMCSMCMPSMDNILALFLMAMKADHQQKIRSILGDLGKYLQISSSVNQRRL